MKVFVTHSMADRDLVTGLATLLRESGDTVFVPAELTGGQDVLSQVSAAIRSADVVVAVLTVGNPSIFYELGLATGASVPTLIAAPVGAPLPANLASTPYVQLLGQVVRDSQAIARRVRELEATSPTEFAKFDSAEAELTAAAHNPAILESLPPFDFERLVKNLFRERGYAVTEDCPDDSGADFIIESDEPENRVLVQVKKVSTQSRVSVDTVRRLLSAISDSGAVGLLVATSDYTAAALSLAAGTRIILRTLDQILEAKSEEELLDTDSRGLAVSLSGIASAWMRKGNLDKAIEYFEQAEALNREIGNQRGQAPVYVGIASAWMRKGNPDKAIEYFEQAEALNREIGNQRGQASAYSGIASAWMRKGNLNRAIECFEQAQALNDEIGDRRGQAPVYVGIASAWMRKGNPDKAIEYFEQAEALNREIGNQRGQASAYSGIASAWMRKGNLNRAIECFEQAQALNDEIGDRRGQASVYVGIASAWMRKGNLNRAIECFEQAAAIQREIGDHYQLSTSLNGIASAWMRKGNPDKAIEYFEQAAVIQREIGAHRRLAVSLEGIAAARAKKGESSGDLEQ